MGSGDLETTASTAGGGLTTGDQRQALAESMRSSLSPVASPTPGPWHLPHFADDSCKCNCRTIVSECYAGAICTVEVDNGLRIGEGGNDAPPLQEAKANARLIVRACNLVMAGKALQDAKRAKIEARGDLPPDLDWGLSETEQAAALMMNALAEENAELLAALQNVVADMRHHLRSNKIDHALIRADVLEQVAAVVSKATGAAQ